MSKKYVKKKRCRIMARLQNRAKGKRLYEGLIHTMSYGITPETALWSLTSDELRLVLQHRCLFSQPTKNERYNSLVRYFKFTEQYET